MKLNELISEISPLRIRGKEDVEIKGLHSDSRVMAKGYLFVAVKGTQADGQVGS